MKEAGDSNWKVCCDIIRLMTIGQYLDPLLKYLKLFQTELKIVWKVLKRHLQAKECGLLSVTTASCPVTNTFTPLCSGLKRGLGGVVILQRTAQIKSPNLFESDHTQDPTEDSPRSHNTVLC